MKCNIFICMCWKIGCFNVTSIIVIIYNNFFFLFFLSYICFFFTDLLRSTLTFKYMFWITNTEVGVIWNRFRCPFKVVNAVKRKTLVLIQFIWTIYGKLNHFIVFYFIPFNLRSGKRLNADRSKASVAVSVQILLNNLISR